MSAQYYTRYDTNSAKKSCINIMRKKFSNLHQYALKNKQKYFFSPNFCPILSNSDSVIQISVVFSRFFTFIRVLAHYANNVYDRVP